jgi:hypothetical protein
VDGRPEVFFVQASIKMTAALLWQNTFTRRKHTGRKKRFCL